MFRKLFNSFGNLQLAAVIILLLTLQTPVSAGWLAPDWADKEPQFPPGSYAWHTDKYPTSPVLYRTVIEVADKPLDFAVLRAKVRRFAYVFLNGRQIAEYIPKDAPAASDYLDVELTGLLEGGKNVLIISTTGDGFSLKGVVKYADGSTETIADDITRWKVQKFAPLTMLEYESCMRPDFDDADWFAVKSLDRQSVKISDTKLESISRSLMNKRLQQLDEDGRWRLNMLVKKGIAVVDWHAYGWAGPQRLESQILNIGRENLDTQRIPGYHHNLAEGLTGLVHLNDEKVNLQNYVTGLKALKAPFKQIEACRKGAEALERIVNQMSEYISSGQYAKAASDVAEGRQALAGVRKSRIVNDLCSCLDNKFGWFETKALLDSDIAGWGLDINSPAEILSSPLSPASLITVQEKEFVISGWETLEPGRIYNKKTPNTGPVCLWAKLDGKVTGLWPGEKSEGKSVAYDRQVNGRLGENWVLLVNDLAAGGLLPIQLVFLSEPASITFEEGSKGTKKVIVTFDEPGARLFILHPLKEWRGFLQMARDLTANPLKPDRVSEFINRCRFWSRALLNYPVTFSEVFLPDPQKEHSIIVADVYNYRRFKDPWHTIPVMIAPMPPLATYGLLMDYPGLEVISKTEILGSRAKWGENIAAVNQNYIVYRVPIDPIKRFGGFTSYCFGPTDIGEPGGITELLTVKRSGSNSYRPQHNQTNWRAIKTIDWCRQLGIQNVFNADEKWVLDVVEHFRTLAEKCKDYPPDAVAYDLLNEPETRFPKEYNALIRKITKAIREIDKTHLIYVEAFPPWAPLAKPFPESAFANLKLTGDPLTCYSFHDYEFRLPPRWPNDKHDIRSILDKWIPVFKYSIENRVPIHLGEFGGFEQTKQSVYTNKCAMTLLDDYFRIFDQFGWHWHYYANRGVVYVRKDGSMRESYVQDAYRRYFAKGTFNVHR